MNEDLPPTRAKLIVAGNLEYPAHPFADKPAIGTMFHTVGSSHVFEVRAVESDPDLLGRFIVHAERI